MSSALLASGRVTGRTRIELESVSPPPPAATVATPPRSSAMAATATTAANAAGVFEAQRRGYDAVCRLLRASTAPQVGELGAWRVRPPSGVLLSGPPGTGKTHLVRAAAGALGVPLVAFGGGGSVSCDGSGEDAAYKGEPEHGSSDTGDGESGLRLRRAFARADRCARTASAVRGAATPCILFLDELDTYCPKRTDLGTSPEQARCVTVLLTLLDGLRSRHGRVLPIGASNRPDAIDAALRRPGRLEWEVPLALPSAEERFAALVSSTAHLPLSTDVRLADVARACSGYAAADLMSLVRDAALHAVRRHVSCGGGVAASGACGEGSSSEHSNVPDGSCATAEANDDGGDNHEPATATGRPAVAASDFERAIADSRASILRPESSGAAQVEALGWDSVGGADAIKRQLQRAIEWPTTHAAAFARLGIEPPRGVLLHGPPGCAKTSLARAAAGSLGVSFFHLSGAALYSPYVGEAERAVRSLFALGRACSPAILFLDELDAIVGTRDAASAGGSSGGGGGGGEAVQLRVLSTLLNEMDGIAPLARVVVMGATNRPEMIDAALKRPGRFDVVLAVPPPDAAGRSQVLQIHTRGMPLDGAVQLDTIAKTTDGWSGAQLSALCREAGMQALRESGMGQGQCVMPSCPVAPRHFELARLRVHGVPSH